MSQQKKNNNKGKEDEALTPVDGSAIPSQSYPLVGQPVITQPPQLTPLGRRNIVKVDPSLVRQALREKAFIPTPRRTDKDFVDALDTQEKINAYVMTFTKDLKNGMVQFHGMPATLDTFFQSLLIVLTDRYTAIALREIGKKIDEIRAVQNDYEEVVKKLQEIHQLSIELLLAYERSILEVAGITSGKSHVEFLAPLEVAQTLGITPIRSEKL